MAVIISDNTNASYDGNLSTANAFDVSRAYNLGTSNSQDSLSTARQIAVTFAGAGAGEKCKGIVIIIGTSVSGPYINLDKSVTVDLQELVGGTTWTTRATCTHTAAEINPGSTTTVLGTWMVPFKFATPYTIDTTAGIWRFNISQGAGTNDWRLVYSTAGNYSYVSWNDATTTFSTTNDTPVIVDKITINQDAQFKPVLGTGLTAWGVCGWECRNTDLTPATHCLLEWSPTPAAAYTLTIDGQFLVSNHSGIRIGTSAVPIPYAQQAKIIFKSVPSVGSVAPSYFRSPTRYYHDAGISYYFYGEIPTTPNDTLNGDANTGQKNVTTTNATGWKSGDTVYIGRENVAGQGNTTENTLSTDAVGTSITLTNNIAGQNRLSGGKIINVTRYGVYLTTDANTTGGFIHHMVNNMVFSGVRFEKVTFTCGQNNAYFRFDLAANHSKWSLTDCAFEGKGFTNFLLSYMQHDYGFEFNRCDFCNAAPGSTFQKVNYTLNSILWIGGPIVVKNCNLLHTSSGLFANTSATLAPSAIVDFENNVIENCINGMGFTGISGTCINNSVYSTASTGFGFQMLSAENPLAFYGNTLNRCGTGIIFWTTSIIVGAIMRTTTFGDIAANTLDVDFMQDIYLDFELASPTGMSTISNNINLSLSGSKFRVTNFSATNDDRVYSKYGTFQRTGTGLTDTTCRTAGGYAMRFTSINPTNRLEWTFTIPTGNIQNKTMMVGIWCNINNSAYWAGTNQLPRLTIDYDNGTTAYVQATQATGWQFLPLPFTPTTTYGQITVTVSTMTDATSTNAYVYFDDFKTLFPAESPLNTQTMDLWANAQPVTPPLATVLSANDVWSASDAVDYGTATLGNRVKKLKNPSSIVDGEIII